MANPVKERRRVLALRALARWIYRHPVWIIVVGGLLGAAGLYLTTKLGYLSNTNDLIRKDAKFHQHYLAYMKEFKVTQDFVVLVKSEDPARNKECLAALAKKFEESGRFSKVFWRLDLSALDKKLLLLAPESELVEMEKGIQKFTTLMASGRQPVFDLNGMLSRANGMFNESFLREEKNWDEFRPFVAQFSKVLDGLAQRLENPAKQAAPVEGLESLLGARGGAADLEKLKAEHEFISFNGGKKLLVLLTPKTEEAGAISPFAKDIAYTREIISETRKAFPDIMIGLTGEPVLDADQVETSMESVARASVITLVLIILLFLFSYKEYRRPLLAVLTLMIAMFWCFGFAQLSIGHLNIISNAFVAMILGLGIDFSIQILGRYEEEIAKGQPYGTALEETMGHTGNAVLTGAGTTGAAFFAMCLNDFSGLAELGIIAGFGVILCVIASLVLFPAFICLVDRNRKNLTATVSSADWRDGIFMKEPMRNKSGLVVLAASVLTGLAVVLALGVKFDYNLLNLQNPKLESVQVQMTLIEGEANTTIFAAMTADSLEDARIKSAALRGFTNTVLTVTSLSDMLPENQEARMAIINRVTKQLKSVNLNTDISDRLDAVRAKREIKSFLDQSRAAAEQARKYRGLSSRARDAEETFNKLIPSLERALAAFEGKNQKDVEKSLGAYQVGMFAPLAKALTWISLQETSKPVTIDDYPPAIRERYLGQTGKYLVEIYPRENIWDREPLTRFVQDVRSIDPNVTGTPVQNYEYLDMLRRAFEQAGYCALGVICVAILIHFRSFKLLLFTLTPLGMGIVWTLGLMSLFKVHFNPANIITLPLVIGIGVAYGIYTVDRFREDPNRSLFDTSTGKAVWLSALTTIFGFGSLIQASYRGISSLGLLMTMGVGMCLITGIYVLPALLRVFNKKKA